MSTDMVTVEVHGVPVRLREEHDFSFLGNLGSVLCVFDEQDSGNVCFGVDTGTERLFVKYAGAKTVRAYDGPEDAVRRLQEAMPVYEALRHPAVVELLQHFPTPDGYAAVFAWFPGEVLHPRWSPAPGESVVPADFPSYRHRQLPMDKRLRTLDTIFAFHEHVAASGFVAIDFYDGCLLYDFSRHVTMICDIDMYARRPYTNGMGRMWGSTHFMSPEEFTLGAALDEVTNVFTMGAAAFVLLGGGKDRSLARWEAGAARHEVAYKAVSEDRSQRHASIASFRRAWDEAEG